jgi:hypothetical protein
MPLINLGYVLIDGLIFNDSVLDSNSIRLQFSSLFETEISNPVISNSAVGYYDKYGTQFI